MKKFTKGMLIAAGIFGAVMESSCQLSSKWKCNFLSFHLRSPPIYGVLHGS